MSQDRAASVRARLLEIAKSTHVDFNQVLVRFALERLLYRLSRSAHADRFVLKGALLFTLWYDMPHRATRDADLLGFGPGDKETVAKLFRDIAAVEVDDGIVFDPSTVSVQDIRKEADYGGVRGRRKAAALGVPSATRPERLLVDEPPNPPHQRQQYAIGVGAAGLQRIDLALFRGCLR